MTEQPFKIPYYAALVRILYDRVDDPIGVPSIGRQLLEDFWKGFQAYLDKLAWRETRLCVRLLSLNYLDGCTKYSSQIQFFAHLTMAKLVSPESMVALLQSFAAVLDEFGVSHGRAKRAAICAAEGLMIVCTPHRVVFDFHLMHRGGLF